MKGKGFRLYVLPLPKMDSAFTTANARISKGEGKRSPERKDHTTNNPSTKSVSAANAAGVKKSILSTTPNHAPSPQFVAWCRKSDQRHIRLIGEYADERKFQYTTKGQWASFIRRNLRAARILSPYTDDQLSEAMGKIDGAKKDYLKKWTLETLAKYLDDN